MGTVEGMATVYPWSSMAALLAKALKHVDFPKVDMVVVIVSARV